MAARNARDVSDGSVHTALRASPNQVSQLALGVPVEREIRGGEAHLFSVSLGAGQYVRLVARRRGIDLLVTVSAPDGRATMRYENPAGPESPLNVSFMAGIAGAHTVEVRPVDRWAAAGSYEIQLEAVRPPTPEDEKRFAAEQKVSEGRRQQLLDTDDSRRAAVVSYEEALALWRGLGDSFEEANTLHFIAQTYKASGRSYFEKAVDSYKQVLARRVEDDRHAVAYTLLGLGEVYRDLNNPANALPHYERALELFKAGNNRRGQAAALYGIGLAKARRREMPDALTAYEQALRLYGDAETRDRHEEARTLHAIGGAYDVLGKPEQALEFFERALAGWRETGDLAQEGNTYSSLAKLDDDRGDWQSALDKYDRALALYAQGEAAAERGKPAIRRTRASTIYNLGFTYAALGDYPKALELLKQSLELRDNPAGQGITLMMIGYVHALAGDPLKALESCRQALPLQEEAGDPRKSHTFTVMGIAYAALGEHRKALEFYSQALEIQQNKERPDGQAEAITQGRRGESHAALGAQAEALAAYDRARQIWMEYKDRNGEALALYGMARSERKRNNLTAALKHVEDALAAIEPLRANVTSQQLRVSYFATKVDYYELYIDLSMRLGDEGRGTALTAAAFEASEKARARSLLDTLSEGRIEAGLKSDPELAALVDKYRRVQRDIQAKAAIRRQIPKEREAAEGAALDLEISKLRSERERTETQLRSGHPRYAALMYPQPLTTAEVQRLLDEDALLLEFSLGDERSFVWAVTTTEMHGYTLPPRSEIEGTARRLVELLNSGQPLPHDTAAQRSSRMKQAEAAYWPQAAAFSRTLLGQVAALSQKKNLIIVADGQLRYLPFAALPPPNVTAPSSTPDGTPLNPFLAGEHQIVSLPSASVLSVLRQTDRHEPTSKSVAIFADPVFEKDDPRIQLASRNRPAAGTAERRESLAQALRDTDDTVHTATLPRLPASAREARNIVSIVPPSSAMEATGFKANRENVTSTQLSQYRIVHFATHGILNEKNPELSGVVLSLYDEQGRFREDGFLRLKDIYSLRLPVELVVLSACRTALGQEVRGEGLIGLTRGFMYAGTPRVIASLWKVDDDATAELMRHLYNKMLKDGLAPAAALASAQASMSKQKRWSHPYYWAGFILQGEPK
ncbi:MAG TPA: CHAT domain-containing protein [Pyrinomonadaceae bacterium]|nr:CHAT domain-containing protein [Pyrinomonadaceae bacterium]